MENHSERIQLFLGCKSVAVAGISAKPKTGNNIAKKFINAGYTVYPLNPGLEEWQGLCCYRDLDHLVGSGITPEAVMIVTRPEISAEIVRAAFRLGIRHIWMHGMMGINPGFGARLDANLRSVDETAAAEAEKAGVNVIAGSCPMQFIEPVDPFHKCLKWVNVKAGNLKL